MGHEIERRYHTHEVRAADGSDASGRIIEGMAAVFNQYADLGWYLEIIEPGSFDGCDVEDAACLLNHNDSQLLGRTSNGTLTLEYRADGLFYRNDTAETQWGNDVLTLVRRRDIHQSSFGFDIGEQSWEVVERSTLLGVVPEKTLDRVSYGGKVEIRRIKRFAKLWDTSPVTYPAYVGTSSDVAKRSRDAALGARQERGGEGGEGDNVTFRRGLDLDLRLKELEML